MNRLSLIKIREEDLIGVSSLALIKGGDDPIKFECGNNSCGTNNKPCDTNACSINDGSCKINNCQINCQSNHQ